MSRTSGEVVSTARSMPEPLFETVLVEQVVGLGMGGTTTQRKGGEPQLLSCKPWLHVSQSRSWLE